MRSLLVGFTLIAMAITAPMMAAQKVELSIDLSKTGAKIDRNIFGQFAETARVASRSLHSTHLL